MPAPSRQRRPLPRSDQGFRPCVSRLVLQQLHRQCSFSVFSDWVASPTLVGTAGDSLVSEPPSRHSECLLAGNLTLTRTSWPLCPCKPFQAYVCLAMLTHWPIPSSSCCYQFADRHLLPLSSNRSLASLRRGRGSSLFLIDKFLSCMSPLYTSGNRRNFLRTRQEGGEWLLFGFAGCEVEMVSGVEEVVGLAVLINGDLAFADHFEMVVCDNDRGAFVDADPQQLGELLDHRH